MHSESEALKLSSSLNAKNILWSSHRRDVFILKVFSPELKRTLLNVGKFLQGEFVIGTSFSILYLLEFLGACSQLIFPIEENLSERNAFIIHGGHLFKSAFTIFHSSTDFFGPSVLLSILVSWFQFPSYFDSPTSRVERNEKKKENERKTTRTLPTHNSHKMRIEKTTTKNHHL